MNCSALIARELRLAIRRPGGGYGLRLLCAWAATAAAFGMLFIWSAVRPGAGFGRPFLQVLAGGGYVGVLLTGMVLTADAISREKREGTLDLLLLTDLRIGDVILGKLLAKMLLPLYGVLAVVPMLEISVLVGGTTAGECARLVLVCANGLFFALAASLLVSSVCKEQRSAYAGTVLAILTMSAGIPLLGWTLANHTANPYWYWGLLLLSPTGPYRFADAYSFFAVWFWVALITNQLLAWGLIAWTRASLIRARSEAVIPSALARPAETQAVGQPAARGVSARQRLLELYPIQWLASRNRRTPWALWLCALGAVGLVLGFEVNPVGTATGQIGVVLLALAHFVFKLGIATDTVHALAVDKRSGALESLLGTRVEVPEIASGILTQFRRRYAGPALVLLIATFMAAVHLFISGSFLSASVLLGVALIIPLDGYGLAWVGLIQGLAARNAAVALGATVFQVVLMPWGWFLIAKAFFWRSSMAELLIIWAALAIVNQCVALGRARARLFEHFRTLALKPYGEKNPPMESEWSPINWEEETEMQSTQA